MKRLSKSASDITNCKKKTHSTSPEEEARELEWDGGSQYGSSKIVGEGAEDGKCL